MSHSYDLMILLDTTTDDEQRNAILADVENSIVASGEIISSQDWGVRQLAYEIEHKTDAEYHLIRFTGPRDLLDALNHSLRITDGVTRYRIIKRRAGMPEPEPPRVDVAAPAPAPAA